MPSELPPLNSLRAFEAAARHLSFNRAAEELNVTPSAVSHQIRQLEEYLGKRLFDRPTRRVELTPEGRAYLQPVQSALDLIRAATKRVRTDPQTSILTVSVAPSVASGWLVQRLAVFQLRHPDIEVRLTTSTDVVDLSRSRDIDVGIRFGNGEWKGLRSHRLMGVHLVPVCSPSLTRGENALKTPQDLGRVNLLHALPRLGDWRSWLLAAGVSGVNPDRGPKFQDMSLAIDAAVAGLGVAIAERRFVAEHIRAGRLTIPFDISLPESAGYYLVYPASREDDAAIQAFRDWILSEARILRGDKQDQVKASPGRR